MNNDLSRRNLIRILGLGSVGAMLGNPTELFAREPASLLTPGDPSLQGAGFFAFTVGEVKVSLVSDGGFVMKAGDVFPKVPKGELEDAAKMAHISLDGYPAQINTLLVRHGSDVILIDTGAGQNFGPTAGHLISNLARAGVTPLDVTHVILSHAHPDHIGGLLTTDGKPRLPKAKVYANQKEYEFWTGENPSMPASLVPPDFQKTMFAAAAAGFAGVKDSLVLVKPDDIIAGVVKVVAAYGHTPGHVALEVGTTDGPKLMYLGDSIVFLPFELKHPDWHVLYDADPVVAADTRRQILERVSKAQSLVSLSHATFPSVGYIDPSGSDFVWTAKPWVWASE